MNLPSHPHETPWYRGRAGIVLLVFLGIAGYFVVTEHWAHVVPWLPYALLLACPLLHVFMHGGHGGHGGHGNTQPPDRNDGSPSYEKKDPSRQNSAPQSIHGGHHHV